MKGVAVFEGQVRVTLDGLGRVVEAGVNSVSPGLDLNTLPSLSPEDAVRTALTLLGAPVPAGLRRLESASAPQASFENPNGRITDAASGPIGWRAAAQTTAAWLRLSLTAGNELDSLDVFPVTAGMSAGSYTGTITITSAGSTRSPITVAVTLTLR